jgi:hypothetical protein
MDVWRFFFFFGLFTALDFVHTGLWWGDLREGDHVGVPGVDGRIILKRIFEKWDGGHGLDSAGSG